MRFFALVCFAIAAFYAWTALDAWRTGGVTPLRGDTSVIHRRDDSASSFQKFLIARVLIAGGFAALGVVMHVFAARFDKLAADAK